MSERFQQFHHQIEESPQLSMFTVSLSYLLGEASGMNHHQLMAILTSAIKSVQDINEELSVTQILRKKKDLLLATQIVQRCRNLEPDQLSLLLEKLEEQPAEPPQAH